MSTTQPARTQKTKPVKLRLACNQCNAAKMKCTGEKTGCRRCRNINAPCIYSESRVGKVQGSRAKKTATVINQASSTVGLASPPTSHAPSGTPDSRGEHASESGFENPPTLWASNLPAGMGTFDSRDDIFPPPSQTAPPSVRPPPSVDAASSVSHQPMSSAASDFFGGGFDFTIDELVRSPVNHLQHATPTLQSQRHPQHLQPPRFNHGHQQQNEQLQEKMASERHQQQQQHDDQQQMQNQTQNAVSLPHATALDSQCILICCQMISSLENYIAAELRVLDIILATVKRTMEKLNHLISLQLESRNTRCIALFSAVLDQIVELMEMGNATPKAKSQIQWPQGLDSSLDVIGHGSFSLGFENFQVDSEDQRAWRSQIVLKELQGCTEILHKLMTLGRMGPKGSTPQVSGTRGDRESCYIGLENRLRALMEQVKRQRIS